MSNTLRIFCIGVILFIAFWIRIDRVWEIPPALSWDEVSIGYNAYSILKTGKDEHGHFLPLDTFVAYGDYKPPIPIYVTVPFVAIFGLNELAVRLPSVVAGTATVLLTYLLTSELFKKLSTKKESNFIQILPILSAFLVSVSPWHIQLSRAGFEANIAVTFLLLGVVLFLYARRRPSVYLLGFIPFIAAIYTFNSARYFSPILCLLVIWFTRSSVKLQKRSVGIGLVIAIITLLPIIPHLASSESRLRLAEVSIFNDYPLIFQTNSRIEKDGFTLWSRIVHNRRVVYARTYLLHFFDHFEPWFLFIRGDGNPKFSIQDVGQMYIIEFPLLVIGLYSIFQKYPRVGWLLILWLLGSLAPAAVARETPHALRIENSLPTWQVFIGAGILRLTERASTSFVQRSTIVMVGLIYIGSIAYFLHTYFIHYPREFSGEWQYGYREAIRYASTISNKYETIVLSESIGRPHMYVLFYDQVDPRSLQNTVGGGFDASGFYLVDRVGKYRFTRSGIGDYGPKVLYILPPEHVPTNAHILHTVHLLNGEPKLVLFDL